MLQVWNFFWSRTYSFGRRVPPPKCKPKATPPIEWLWLHAALLLRIHPRIPTGDHCLGEIQVARSATDFGIFLYNGEKCRSHNRSGTPYFRPVGGPSSKQPSPSYFRPVVGGWGPFFNQNNQALDQKKSKPGAMIVLFFSKQPSPSYFRPVVVVGDPSSIKTTKSLIKTNPNLEQNPIPN